MIRYCFAGEEKSSQLLQARLSVVGQFALGKRLFRNALARSDDRFLVTAGASKCIRAIRLFSIPNR